DDQGRCTRLLPGAVRVAVRREPPDPPGRRGLEPCRCAVRPPRTAHGRTGGCTRDGTRGHTTRHDDPAFCERALRRAVVSRGLPAGACPDRRDAAAELTSGTPANPLR